MNHHAVPRVATLILTCCCLYITSHCIRTSPFRKPDSETGVHGHFHSLVVHLHVLALTQRIRRLSVGCKDPSIRLVDIIWNQQYRNKNIHERAKGFHVQALPSQESCFFSCLSPPFRRGCLPDIYPASGTEHEKDTEIHASLKSFMIQAGRLQSHYLCLKHN